MATNPHYDVVLVDRTPAQSTAPTFTEIDRIPLLDGLGWSKELNNDGYASVSTRPERLSDAVKTRLRDLANNPVELWLYRDNAKVYAGPVIGIQVQGQSQTITILSRGLLYYVRWMFVLSDLSYTSTDQGTIVKALIDQWQNEDYGDFGIDTTSIGTTGVTRTIDYFKDELRNVAKAISDLSKDSSGFDFTIDPSTRDFTLYTPIRGSDVTQSFVLDERVLANPNLFYDMTFRDFGTTVLATGTDYETSADPLYKQAYNTTARNAWGLAGIGANFDGVVDQATLDRYAQDLIDTYSQTRIVFGGQGGAFSGGANTFTPVEGMTPADVDPGDTILFSYDYGLGHVDEQRDVAGVYVTVNDKGGEQMKIALV